MYSTVLECTDSLLMENDYDDLYNDFSLGLMASNLNDRTVGWDEIVFLQI